MLGDGAAAANEPLVGSGDIQSLADLSNSFDVVRTMRPVPRHDADRRAQHAILITLAIGLVFASAPAMSQTNGGQWVLINENLQKRVNGVGIHPFPGGNDLLPFDQQLGHRRPQPLSNGNLNICFKRYIFRHDFGGR